MTNMEHRTSRLMELFLLGIKPTEVCNLSSAGINPRAGEGGGGGGGTREAFPINFPNPSPY